MPTISAPDLRPNHRGLSQARPHIPFLLYGVLSFCLGISAYLFGVLLGVPRLVFGLSRLREVQEYIVWYSGIPIIFGIILALTDVLVFFNNQRRRTPLPMAPLANRHVTVALTAYNDEASISDAVADFRTRLEVRRVIVVSNESTDSTFARADSETAYGASVVPPELDRATPSKDMSSEAGPR